jgi:hypothetical protein
MTESSEIEPRMRWARLSYLLKEILFADHLAGWKDS